jgi:hypothetical protein
MAKKTRKKWIEIPKFATIAAILVALAALLTTVCMITSGKAGGEASGCKTAALGFMMLRLESATEASTSRVQAQTYLTQAGMYLAYAERENNEDIKLYLENLYYTSLDMSNFQLLKAENAENRASSYYDSYDEALSSAATLGQVADYRSTGGLIFTVSATLASLGILLKMKEILYLYIPIFAIGLFYLIISFL